MGGFCVKVRVGTVFAKVTWGKIRRYDPPDEKYPAPATVPKEDILDFSKVRALTQPTGETSNVFDTGKTPFARKARPAEGGRFFHVAREGYKPGEDLLSAVEHEDEKGEAPPDKWGDQASVGDAYNVHLFGTMEEAETFQTEYESSGSILAVDLPPVKDGGPIIGTNDEGHPTIRDRIPAEYISTPDTPPPTYNVPEKDFSEAAMAARSARHRAEETQPPTFTKYQPGTLAADSDGDLWQLQDVDIDDMVLPEGIPQNRTVDKYMDWYFVKVGGRPPSRQRRRADHRHE